MESSRQERNPQDSDKFIVRLPEGMRDTLKTRAASNNRSMNAELVAILGATLSGQSGLGDAPVEALLKEAAARLGTTVQIHFTPATSAVPAKAATRKAK